MLLNMSVLSYLWVPSLLLPCYLQPQIPAAREAVNKYVRKAEGYIMAGLQVSEYMPNPFHFPANSGEIFHRVLALPFTVSCLRQGSAVPTSRCLCFFCHCSSPCASHWSTVPNSHSEILQTIIPQLFSFWSLRISSHAVPLAACLSMASS